MGKIQPCLVPCKGTLADLHVVNDPNNSDRIQVYWGTSVLQVVPRNKNSVIFRIVAGMLAMLKFKMSSICKTFEISEKTLRFWREALSHGDWDSISEIFHGPGMPKKLRSDVDAYVRGRYRKATNEARKPTPRGFCQELLKELDSYWKIVVSEEALRQVFRDEDENLGRSRSTNSQIRASQGQEEIGKSICQENVENENKSGNARQSSPSVGSLLKASALEQKEKLDVNKSQDVGEKNREENCEIENNPQLMATKTPNITPVLAAPELKVHHTTSDESDLPDTKAAETEREKRQEVCVVPSNKAPGTGKSNKVAPDLAKSSSLEKETFPCCLARSSTLLWNKVPSSPVISQHAGLVTLSSWFDRVFSSHPPIIGQVAAQILCGAVNPEKSKLIDYNGLEAMIGDAIRDIDHQHTLLSQNSNSETILSVYRSNAELLNLYDQRNFYFDPHHEKYTGIENLLIGWNGCSHCMCKGIMLDFIHTEWGSPCFVGHFDSFYDCRQRFLILRKRFLELFPGKPGGGFSWIQDRGFWGLDFLGQIADEGDFFIQWEKNYKNSRWDEPSLKRGRFTWKRSRNSKKDKRSYRFKWKEQSWDTIPGGRRIIVRARHPKGKKIEVSIVTNNPNLSPEKIIRLMFNRWLQEGDFAYLNRHFGINELTGRLFQSYEQIADELQDRNIDSRAYKLAQATKKKVSAKIGQLLVHLQGEERVSLDGLNAQRHKLTQQLEKISQELDCLKAGEATPKKVSGIGRKIERIKARILAYKQKKKKEHQLQEKEEKIKILTSDLEEVKQQLARISKTESRLLVCIQEGRVRPDMRKKALVDAIRITCRNIFWRAFDIFRPLYNNRRDDHVILRAITRSSGVIVPFQGRIDVYLTAQLQREPAEWQRIQKFLEICQHHIAGHFSLPIRILVRKSSAQILYAANRVPPGN